MRFYSIYFIVLWRIWCFLKTKLSKLMLLFFNSSIKGRCDLQLPPACSWRTQCWQRRLEMGSWRSSLLLARISAKSFKVLQNQNQWLVVQISIWKSAGKLSGTFSIKASIKRPCFCIIGGHKYPNLEILKSKSRWRGTPWIFRSGRSALGQVGPSIFEFILWGCFPMLNSC